MDKVVLRKIMRQKLKEQKPFLEESHQDVSSHLCNLIQNLISEKKLIRPNLGGFAPILEEPIWWKLFPSDLGCDYSLVHMQQERRLTYHPLDLAGIKHNDCAIRLAPDLRTKSVIPDIVLVPGLAFTREGERLGRGKGYFDSFLEHYKGIRVGVFFSCQEVQSVFCEKHDEKLNYIVTEKEVIRGL